MNNPARIPTAVLLLIFFAALQNSSSEQIVDLHSDYRVTPLAVDRSDPLLSWRLEGTRSGLSQTAYQIHAATTLDKLDQPDLWDSS